MRTKGHNPPIPPTLGLPVTKAPGTTTPKETQDTSLSEGLETDAKIGNKNGKTVLSPAGRAVHEEGHVLKRPPGRRGCAPVSELPGHTLASKPRPPHVHVPG